MLTRLLSSPVASFEDGGTITLNARIGGQIGKSAVHRATKSLKFIATCSEPMADLAEVAADLATLRELVPQIEKAALDTLAASEVIEGQTITATGPLIDTAMNVRALADAITIAEPQADLAEVERVKEVLSRTAHDLARDAVTLKTRADKLETILKTAVGEVLARADVDPFEVLEKHAGPDGWNYEPPPPAEVPGPDDYALLQAAGKGNRDYARAWFLKWSGLDMDSYFEKFAYDHDRARNEFAEDVTAAIAAECDRPVKVFRARFQKHKAEERAALRVKKADAKDKRRADLIDRAKGVWANV